MKVDESILAHILGAHLSEVDNDVSDSPMRPSHKGSAGNSLHEKLHTQRASLAVKKWFQAQATVVSRASSAPGALRGGVRSLAENDFVSLMRRLTDLPDHDILDLVDILDKEERGGVLLPELYLVLALLCAKDLTQRLEVLFLHGEELYGLVAGERGRGGWQAVRLLGCLLRIKDSVLWDTTMSLAFSLGPALAYEDFQLLFYAALKAGDDGQLVGKGPDSNAGRAGNSSFSLSKSPSILDKLHCMVQ